MAIFSTIIAYVGAAAFNLGIGLNTIFAVQGFALSLIPTLIGSAISGVLNQRKTSPQEIQATINQAMAPRRRGYGLNRIGGVRFFFEQEGGVLHIGIAHHEGPISNVVQFVVDGLPVTLDGNGITIGANDFQGRVHIKFDNATGASFADLRAAFPTLWTTDHKLAGVVTTYMRLSKPKPEDLTKVFPKLANTPLQIDAECVEVYDPRTDTTAYSNDPALCIRDFLISKDGHRIPEAFIEEDSFSAAATVNEALVPTDDSTQPRYITALMYGLQDNPKDVLADLLACCDASLYMTPEGKIGILPGVYSEPDVTIGGDDILNIVADPGRDPLESFNVLKGVYTSPEHAFKLQECAELRDEADLLDRGEETDELIVPACPDAYQMQRLMRSYRARKHPEWVLTITTNLVGIKARFPKGDGIHTIEIDHPRWNGVYEVMEHAADLQARKCVIKCRSIFDAWTVDGADLLPPPTPLDDLAQNTKTVIVPENLTLSQEVVAISGTTNGVQLVASVDNPGRDDLPLSVEYRLAGDTEWTEGTSAPGTFTISSGIVGEGDYEVRASWVGERNLTDPIGAETDPETYGYTATETITAVSNPTAPDAPTDFTAVASGGPGPGPGGGSDIVLDWTNGVAGYFKTRIYSGTTSSFGSASFLADVTGVAGQPSTYTDTPAAGTWYYWVVTLNPSLVASTETGPQSDTV